MLAFHACEELDGNCHSCSCLWFVDCFLVYWLWSIGRCIHIVQSSLALSPLGAEHMRRLFDRTKSLAGKRR